MKGHWRAGCAGCLILILLCSLALGDCTLRFFQSMQREPELPIQQLLHRELEAFPSGWTLGKSDIITDTDFTWAHWAVFVNFNYKNGLRIAEGLKFAGEEIHVFNNSFAARLISYPSPSSLSAGKGYIPKGWTYRPPHAERFEFGCSGGDGLTQPEGCSFILRYAEYIIVFSTPIADYMTLDDLQRVLEVIDQEMTRHLKNSTLRPGPRPVPAALDN